jgi:hypothetical protein
MNSREKGKRGERQWRDELRANGYCARRGQQFAGSAESPDVVCDELPWIHFEVKAVERLNVQDAMDQSRRDCGAGVSSQYFRETAAEIRDALTQPRRWPKCQSSRIGGIFGSGWSRWRRKHFLNFSAHVAAGEEGRNQNRTEGRTKTMSMLLQCKESSKPHPEGIHPAVCVDVIDLGLVEVEFQGLRRMVHKVKVM